MLSIQRKFAVDDLGAALAGLLPADELARLLNFTIGAEAEPRLSDYQVELIARLHDRLCDLRPDAVQVAQNA